MSKGAFTEDDKRLKFLPEQEAIVPPKGLITHIKDHWWLVHPTKGLLFYCGHDRRAFSAQANSNKDITKRLHWIAPWAEIKFIPSVFHRIEPRDYC